MPFLNVDGDKLHFTDEGTGAPLVFVHGSCGGAGQWRVLAKMLQENYRTICIDLFGSGQSEPWPLDRVWSAADDERAIGAVLDMIGEPIHFIIHSAGGVFSYATICKRRDQILSLTLFEPVYFHLLKAAGDPLFAEPDGIANNFRAAIDDGDLERAMTGFVDGWASRQGAWKGLPAPVQDAMKQAAYRLYYEWECLHYVEPAAATLVRWDIPTLLFKGSRTLPSMHQVCEILRTTLPEIRLIEIEGAGHMSPFTHAADAYPEIRSHLAHLRT